MYLDFQKYGTDYFDFQILEEVEPEHLKEKEKEQWFIELLKPTYNNYNAKDFDTKRNKKLQKEYYQQNHKRRNEYQKEYGNQPCCYNGDTITLHTLSERFRRAGVEHPTIEAKKYLVL